MRVFTIAWDDGLSAKAFVSWYKKSYCPKTIGSPNVLMLTLLNSEDILLDKYRAAKEACSDDILFVTLAMKRTQPNDRIPSFLVEESEFVIRTDRDMNANPVKVPDKYSLLIGEWAKHIKAFSTF